MRSEAVMRPARTSAVVLLAVATVAALAGALLWPEGRQALTVPLPYRRMDIPVLWWGICAAYAASACRLLRGDAAMFRTLLFDGLILHLEWLLVVFLATFPLGQYLTRPYQAYVVLVVSAAAAGTSYIAARIGRAAWTEPEQGAALARLPMSLGSVVMASYAVCLGQWWVAAASAAGWIAGWHGRLGALVQRVSSTRRWVEWGGVAMLAVLAVGIRLAWYVHLVSVVGMEYSTGFLAASDDGQFYHTAAAKIAAHPGVLLDPSANPLSSSAFDPLYPLLLGFWYRLIGTSFFPAVLAQCLLSGIFVVVMYRIGKEFWNGSRRVGFLTAAFAAVSQPLIFSSATYGIEALLIPAMAVWIWLAGRYAMGDRNRWVIFGMGICGGLLLGLRRSALPLLLAMLVWMLWPRSGGPRRTRLLHWLAIAGIAVLLYAPVEWLYVNSGRARLLPKAGSSYSYYWRMPSKRPEVVPDNQRFVSLGIDPFQDLPGSVRSIMARPADVAKAVWDIVPWRLLLFFFWAPFGHFNTVTLINPTIPNILTPTLEFYLALAVILGIVALASRASHRALGALLLLTIGVQAFVHAVLSYTMTIRYSTPIRPFLILFGAIAVARLIEGMSRAASPSPRPSSAGARRP